MAFLSYNGLLYFWHKIKALLDGKVDKIDGKGLSTNDYTTAEKNKLAGLMNYIHPTTSGNKHIPAGGSANQILGWSADGTAKWVNEKDTTYSVMSGATVNADGKSGLVPIPTKGAQRWLDSTGAWTTPPNTTYGAASTTSAGLMSAADKKKLDGVADGANKYVHPATSGNKHIPVGGSDGMILGWSADGTAKWVADKDTTYTNFKGATTDTAGSSGLVNAPAKGQQGLYLRGDGTWGTPSNTWRGIQNNLTSDSTNDSLAAAQGKALKALVDGKAASNHTHTKSQITDFPALGTAAAKNVRTLTAQGASGWKDAATDQQYVPDMSFIAYWNGAYSGTSSNLIYCNRGAFGTIVTKNTSDYAVAGHTHTWDSVTGKPSTFTPSSHIHGVIKSLSVNGTTITCTKDDGTTSTITTQDTNTTYGTFKGATTSEAGSTGLVIAPVAGNANRYLRSDGTWAVPPDTNTTYGVFAKATADAAGSTGLVPAPAKGQQTYYLRGDGTWAVPANTWRGIQDNLTSSSTTDSLSANQGKVLKGLIDGKAASGHTHNYAGSSSAGGAATSANKVNAALTINLNGTSQGAWDGSSAKSISITAASVGATSVTISRW